MQDRDPDFIGIGAPRCGTTWLANSLRRHSQVCVSQPKEITYFCSLRIPAQGGPMVPNEHCEKPLSWYRRHFSHCAADSVTGEVTPSYLIDPDAAARIHDHYPSVKLIACLRNPIERAYSHYWFMRGHKRIADETFEAAVENQPWLLEMGFYAPQLRRYLDLFPRDQVLVMISEEMRRQRGERMEEILGFLGVSPGEAPQLVDGWGNQPTRSRYKRFKRLLTVTANALTRVGLNPVIEAMRRAGLHRAIRRINAVPLERPQMSPDFREHLTGVFAESVEELEEMLGRSLALWNVTRPAG